MKGDPSFYLTGFVRREEQSLLRGMEKCVLRLPCFDNNLTSASVDKYNTHSFTFYAHVSTTHDAEVLSDLNNHVKDRFHVFYKSAGCSPRNGQFDCCGTFQGTPAEVRRLEGFGVREYGWACMKVHFQGRTAEFIAPVDYARVLSDSVKAWGKGVLDQSWVWGNFFREGAYIGPPAFEGGMILDGSRHVSDWGHLTRVYGDLHVSSCEDMNSIEMVSGTLALDGCDKVRDLPRLKRVKDLRIHDCPLLTSLSGGPDIGSINVFRAPLVYVPLSSSYNVNIDSEETVGLPSSALSVPVREYYREISRYAHADLSEIVENMEHNWDPVRCLIELRLKGEEVKFRYLEEPEPYTSFGFDKFIG